MEDIRHFPKQVQVDPVVGEKSKDVRSSGKPLLAKAHKRPKRPKLSN